MNVLFDKKMERGKRDKGNEGEVYELERSKELGAIQKIIEKERKQRMEKNVHSIVKDREEERK